MFRPGSASHTIVPPVSCGQGFVLSNFRIGIDESNHVMVELVRSLGIELTMIEKILIPRI